VVPVVAGLKKQGANSGAALSFMIATPESGVDSIAVSWAMLDPIMTIIRPFQDLSPPSAQVLLKILSVLKQNRTKPLLRNKDVDVEQMPTHLFPSSPPRCFNNLKPA